MHRLIYLSAIWFFFNQWWGARTHLFMSDRHVFKQVFIFILLIRFVKWPASDLKVYYKLFSINKSKLFIQPWNWLLNCSQHSFSVRLRNFGLLSERKSFLSSSIQRDPTSKVDYLEFELVKLRSKPFYRFRILFFSFVVVVVFRRF